MTETRTFEPACERKKKKLSCSSHEIGENLRNDKKGLHSKLPVPKLMIPSSLAYYRLQSRMATSAHGLAFTHALNNLYGVNRENLVRQSRIAEKNDTLYQSNLVGRNIIHTVFLDIHDCENGASTKKLFNAEKNASSKSFLKGKVLA